MMFPRAKLCAAVAFSLFVAIATVTDALPLARRGKSVLIGFRTVSAEQAEIYRKAGNKLVWSAPQSSAQIGPGTYISPKLGDWAGAANGWYCAIQGDSEEKWKLVNKAWLPEKDGDKMLWTPKGEPNVPAFLKKLNSSFTVDNTVLFSKILGFELLQLALPKKLQPGLGLAAHCAAKTDTVGVKALEALGIAQWSSWTIKGVPQTVHLELI